MIEAESFVEAARNAGLHRYTGVPCSFLTPFINYVINDETLSYISSANEGDAVATAAGSAIGGTGAVAMMQNSGLGNAVSPLTSLTYVFKIPVLLITTHRGAPGLKDEPQHVLMGKITGELFETMEVPWAYFPSEETDIAPALGKAVDYMQQHERPYAFIMRKGTVAPHELIRDPVARKEAGIPVEEYLFSHDNHLPSRTEAIKKIVEHTPPENTVVLATTGYTGRELYALEDRPNQLYMVGSMGCVSSLGLGLALARPDLTVVVIDGDGAALMRMGNFSTLGSYGGNNLVHVLLDNGVHDSTGAQATVSANVNFSAIASACGYGAVYQGENLDVIDRCFEAVSASGPRFAHLRIRPGTIDKLPRPDVSPAEVVRRLMHHIGTAF